MELGEKIKELRKERKISQDELAKGLGISFQAVSKWETGVSMPDIFLLPAIASMFGVSIDELFEYDHFKTEERIMEIVYNAAEIRGTEPKRAEEMLREALKRYPGNEILLNNLLYTIRSPARDAEVIVIAKTLAESARYDDVRYDALRILAETYSRAGKLALAEEAIEKIPEIYFTKLEVAAENLCGEKRIKAAMKQRNLSAESLIDMEKILTEEGIEPRDNYEKLHSVIDLILKG